MKITQIYNREDAKMREFTDKSNALGRAQQEQIFVFGIFRPLVYMLYISSVLCLLYLGGKGYLEGTSFLGQTLTSGMIVSFYMYISKFFAPDAGKLDRIRRILHFWLEIQNREYFLGGCKCGLQPVELLRQVLDRVEEF